MRSTSEWAVLPLGLRSARRPIAKNGSSAESAGDLAIGSNRAAARPRCESTKRSPLPTRRRIASSFLRNSSMVKVLIHQLNLKLNQPEARKTPKQILIRFGYLEKLAATYSRGS